MSIAITEVGDWLPPPGEIFRITVDRYVEWCESGPIDEDERVELLDGVIVHKMTKNQPHVVCRKLCREELTRLLRPGFRIIGEAPVRIAPWSMPEPDLFVLRGGLRDYVSRRPVPADLALCVEVSDSGLSRDRG